MDNNKQGTKMRLRSSITPEERDEIEKQKLRLLDAKENPTYLEYSGEVIYYTEFFDIAMACDNLIKLVEDTCEYLVFGFDAEWPFNFNTGPGKVAVLQISPSLTVSYVLQISKLKKLPKGLSVLLAHPKTRLTGVNVKNDCRKLARDFPGFNVEKMVKNCIDSGHLANSVFDMTHRWSMERLVWHLELKRINKNKKVRMSKWHIVPLSEEQLRYAATDAYASLLLYINLKERELTKKIEGCN